MARRKLLLLLVFPFAFALITNSQAVHIKSKTEPIKCGFIGQKECCCQGLNAKLGLRDLPEEWSICKHIETFCAGFKATDFPGLLEKLPPSESLTKVINKERSKELFHWGGHWGYASSIFRERVREFDKKGQEDFFCRLLHHMYLSRDYDMYEARGSVLDRVHLHMRMFQKVKELNDIATKLDHDSLQFLSVCGHTHESGVVSQIEERLNALMLKVRLHDVRKFIDSSWLGLCSFLHLYSLDGVNFAINGLSRAEAVDVRCLIADIIEASGGWENFITKFEKVSDAVRRQAFEMERFASARPSHCDKIREIYHSAVEGLLTKAESCNTLVELQRKLT
eukprot:GFYU01005603.1.p1 GENE.GFYU01005603.1~~GFYU01005603.1.p1  ORF type:complete len:337 (-),score=0.72 GFYU01005603.1:90-1100(-)